jgi:hypothetical protein
MTMNVSLSNRRSTIESTGGARDVAPSVAPAQAERAQRAQGHAEPAVIVDRGPSPEQRRLDRVSGQTCPASPTVNRRASEEQIEAYRRALSQGRTPPAPPAPPPLPTVTAQQVVTTLARSLPADHPLRVAMSQVAWQDSNRPPITDWIHRTLIPLIGGGVDAGVVRRVAAFLVREMFPDATGGSVGHHGVAHLSREGIEHALTHAIEHATHGMANEARQALLHRLPIIVNHLSTAVHVLDSAIMTGRELSRVFQGEVIPTAAIVDAQRTQEINRARESFDAGVGAAVGGSIDCARMSRDRIYAMGVEAGAQYRRQHGEALDAMSRHSEAMTVARQRNLRSPTEDVRPLMQAEQRPGEAARIALERAVLEDI